MSRTKGSNPSPALVIALIALFVALGSGAYAASKIGTKDLKNEAVTGKKLAKNAVKSSKTKNGGDDRPEEARQRKRRQGLSAARRAALRHYPPRRAIGSRWSVLARR
jgi:hypothetical protein